MTNNSKLLELLNSYKLDTLKTALEQNIREENQKKAGTAKKEVSIINNMLKKAAKDNPNKAFQKTHEWIVNGTTLYAFIDGYRVLASVNDFNYEHAEEHERLKIETLIDVNDAFLSYESIVLDRNEISFFEKDHAGYNKKRVIEKPYTIELDDRKVAAFNPSFLLDALDFVGDNKLYFPKVQSACLKSPALIINEKENKYALILPVNIQDIEKSLDYMESWRNKETIEIA